MGFFSAINLLADVLQVLFDLVIISWFPLVLELNSATYAVTIFRPLHHFLPILAANRVLNSLLIIKTPSDGGGRRPIDGSRHSRFNRCLTASNECHSRHVHCSIALISHSRFALALSVVRHYDQ